MFFFKIGVLKNLGIFTRKHLRWSLFFDKVADLKVCIFIKKETPTQVFFYEYCEIFENNSFIEHFYVMIELFGHLWIQKWYFPYFLCHCFVLFHNSSVRIGSTWLFCACIYTNIFSKYNLRTDYNVGIRNNIQYCSNFSL